MKRSKFTVVLLLIFSNVFSQDFQWWHALPEEEGFSTEKTYAMRDTLIQHGTKTLLVIRNDKILLEWYARDWHPKRPHYTASLAKALVGGMSLSLALSDGRLQPDDPAWKYVPEWKDHPQKSGITVRHLVTHTSGLADSRPSDIEGTWENNFWKRLLPPNDPFTISRDLTPVLFEPGTEYEYSNPGLAMLSYIVTASYKGTSYGDIRTLLQERIMNPIGVQPNEWNIGYGNNFNVSGLNLVANWGGGAYTARAAARVGRLMLNNGNWEGEQLIDAEWIDKATKYGDTPLPSRHQKQPSPASTLGWYNNFDGIWSRAPRDAFLGAGAENQHLIIIPSLKIIIVRNGDSMYDEAKGEGFYYGIEKYLINLLMDAFMEPPYPMSDYITDIKFAPVESIVRKAEGSDNWPLTWAVDDAMYTAYGDGWGFEPKVEKKLSLGLSKIVGEPGNFKGINIRSKSGEHIGEGRYGKKASGMLMVDGILYMMIRNANQDGEHSQLAWSGDKGESWTFSDWMFTEGFGCPTFLNFGKNYHGARDEYVYLYSQDNTSAYKTSDRMVMARVPKSKIKDREAYEFFKGLDERGSPLWSELIEDRDGVFINPANCYRSGITYNAALKRYLWCQTLLPSNHPQGVRFQGGFGIYEAPEPWGPWRTVFYTKDWDVGPGETSSIPVKWMSEDGKTCYLVFSGDDYFSVRKLELMVDPASDTK
jgi:CubicO group peptidase (beta-lactamase class C family)